MNLNLLYSGIYSCIYFIIIQLNFCLRSSCKHVREMYTPLHPHLDIVQLGSTGVYIFSYFVLKRRLREFVEAVLTCTHNLGLEQK